MIKRIAIVVFSVLTLIYLPYNIGRWNPFGFRKLLLEMEDLSKMDLWMCGFLLIFSVSVGLFLVGLIIYALYDFIVNGE